MPHNVRIAIDVMGGDAGASVVVPGAELSLLRHPDIQFILFGDQAAIAPRLGDRLKAASRLVHTDVAVRMDDKPSSALRNGRWKSSMWLAIDAVKASEADVAVSAGNTGALMAMAKFNLKTMQGISRPAIAAFWPTLTGRSIVLDVGASIGADAQRLVDLAVMGSAMARVFNVDRPTVGLLNMGIEEINGLESLHEAGRILREAKLPDFDYVGFIQGSDIGKGETDVVVTECFAGNIAIKTAEGTARHLTQLLRVEMKQTLSARLGSLLARRGFARLRGRMDPNKANGGIFLGLNGIVIKSHGGANAEGFAAAIDLGYEMARCKLLGKIRQTLDHYTRHSTAAPAVAQHDGGGQEKPGHGGPGS